MLLKQIYDRSLSQYSYLIGCPKTGEALIIDAQRDVDRYLDLAEAHDLRITAAAETHIHADFLGGVRQLVDKVDGVKGYLSKEGGEDWQYEWAQDRNDVQLLSSGDVFEIGSLSIQAIHTPGHTPEHLSFLIKYTDSDASPYGLASGDFMFVGDVGRPDLLEEAAGESGSRESSAKALYDSIDKFSALEITSRYYQDTVQAAPAASPWVPSPSRQLVLRSEPTHLCKSSSMVNKTPFSKASSRGNPPLHPILPE